MRDAIMQFAEIGAFLYGLNLYVPEMGREEIWSLHAFGGLVCFALYWTIRDARLRRRDP